MYNIKTFIHPITVDDYVKKDFSLLRISKMMTETMTHIL